jgi:hypothetical protein
MSQHMVRTVIDRLLTDEDLRVRFALDRIDALALIRVLGFELTSDEIDLFFRSDARLWFWSSAAVGDLVH